MPYLHSTETGHTSIAMSDRLRSLFFALVLLLNSGCSLMEHAMPHPESPALKPSAILPPQSEAGFFAGQVQYPMPVNYYSAMDDRNQLWEIAVADSARRIPVQPDAPALVLIHGRGADSGYFYQLIRHATENGLRVIAVDLPGHGKSIPGNLDNDIPLPLSDSRKLVHDVLVNQMGLTNATYLGHSLGGQWVLGYALAYPDAVDKLILESPYGLEEYDDRIAISPTEQLDLFDPLLRYDYTAWKAVWDRLGYFNRELAKTVDDIRYYHYFERLNPETGKIEASPVGLFRTHSMDSNYLTRMRTQLLWAPARELERYLRVSEWEIYAQGVELRKDNPDSLLKHLDNIQAPVFMAFGRHDPFLPNRAFSGNTNLRTELIKPAFIRLSGSGQLPLVVFYPESGHVPHADEAASFARDVVQFIRYGEVVSPEEDPLSY